jgi:hypothetical protein
LVEQGRWSLLTVVLCVTSTVIWAGTQFLPVPSLPDPFLGYFTDDAFYYFKVADNLTKGHGSSFDGLVPTNGYHPLWLLLLTALRLLSSSALGFSLLVTLVSLLALGASAFMAFRLLTLMGYGSHLAKLAGVAVFTLALARELKGMENLLLMPMLFGLVLSLAAFGREPSWRRGLASGALAAATVLSRLDSVLMVAALLVAFVIFDERFRAPQAFRRLLGSLTVGSIPVLIYVLVNQLYFGTLLPISGRAKHLRDVRGFSSTTWESIFHRKLDLHPALTFSALLVVALVSVMRYRTLRPLERVVIFAGVGFCLVHYGLLSWSSDWQLWPWYHYGALFMAPVSVCALLTLTSRQHSPVQALALGVVLAGALASSVARFVANPGADNKFYRSALQIADFADRHPGRYAMGDRAGMVGFLSRQPVLQLEGLMADRWLLDAMSRHADLNEVFSHYGVEYYVATNLERDAQGCWQAVEPRLAGPMAPHMTMRICDAPLFDSRLWVWRTQIFRIGR